MYLLIAVTLLLITSPFGKALFETKVWPQKKTEENKKEKESYSITYKQFVKRQALIDTSQSSTTLSAEGLQASSPCTVHYCMTETVVDCKGLSLTEVRSVWFPTNTTVIMLDNNDLQELNNTIFSHLTELRILDLSNNAIHNIQENAFMGLDNLETLNLEYNLLKEIAYPEGIFDPLSRLKDLRLRFNKESLHLPGKLFRQLTNLRVLTIDAAGEAVSVGEELRNLSNMVLSGDIIRIDENFFENVPNISHLTITDISSLSDLRDNALESLHQLDVLKLRDLTVDLRQSLRALKPLAGKTMTTIEFYKLFLTGHEKYSTLINNEGILDLEMTKYLTNICVTYCALISCRIFVIKANAFSSSVWDRCLRGLDLSDNPLLGTKTALSVILNFKHIEIILLTKIRRVCYDKDSISDQLLQQQSSISKIEETSSVHEKPWCKERNDINDNIDHVEGDISQLQSLMPENNPILNSTSSSKGLCPRETSIWMKTSGHLIIYVSSSLKYIRATESVKNALGNVTTQFVGANNLVYLDLRDSILSDFRISLYGLDALESLLLSENDASVLCETFFDSLCHLKELDLSNCHLDAGVMSNHSARVFYNLRDLQRLDLSLNFLQSFKPGTFSPNNKLEIINLSKNRFKNIPFDIRNVPKLKRLDLRENSMTTLATHETNALDNLANQPGGFRLFMAGNILSCGCGNIRFLHWLQTTSVKLDDTKHFPCINNEGELSDMSSFTDLEMMWRKCLGKVFFSIALLLLCTLVVGFLVVFVVWKNKTFIMSKLLLMLTGYLLEEPGDYPTGVFIGYAEEDYHFPCFGLSPFIEAELNLTTYVYNRDNIPHSDRAQSIVDAINNSWRVILIFSANFLVNDDWAMFTTRTAIYGLSPANTARIVVLVIENLHHRLPQELLCSVPDENILVLSSWEMNDVLWGQLRLRLKK